MMIVHTCPNEEGKKSYKFSLVCDHCGEIITDEHLGWCIWAWPIEITDEIQSVIQTVHEDCVSGIIDSRELEEGLEWYGCHTEEMSKPEGSVGRIYIE